MCSLPCLAAIEELGFWWFQKFIWTILRGKKKYQYQYSMEIVISHWSFALRDCTLSFFFKCKPLPLTSSNLKRNDWWSRSAQFSRYQTLGPIKHNKTTCWPHPRTMSSLAPLGGANGNKTLLQNQLAEQIWVLCKSSMSPNCWAIFPVSKSTLVKALGQPETLKQTHHTILYKYKIINIENVFQ